MDGHLIGGGGNYILRCGRGEVHLVLHRKEGKKYIYIHIFIYILQKQGVVFSLRPPFKSGWNSALNDDIKTDFLAGSPGENKRNKPQKENKFSHHL